MSAKFKKLAAVGAIAIGGLTTASAADASVVVSPSPTAFTATATTHAILTIHGASSTISLDCVNHSLVGVLTSSVTRAFSASVNPRFSSCVLGGFLPFTVSCTGTDTFTTTAPTVGGVTPGTLGNINCQITVTSLPGCTFTLSGASGPGSVRWSYNNATHQLRVFAAGQDLAVNSVPAACAATVPTGPATLTAPAGADLIYNVVPTTLTITGT